jgi:hypothetical protein
MSRTDSRDETADGGEAAVHGMVALVEHQFLELFELAERLVLEPIRDGWDAGEPARWLTADQVRGAAPSEQSQIRAAVLRWARQEQRAAGRNTAEDILYGFLAEGAPPAIRVETRRRGRAEIWTPDWEVLLVASLWPLMGVEGDRDSAAAARGLGERGLLKAAAEKHAAFFGDGPAPATTRNRYHIALRRNRYAKAMVTLAEVLHLSTWLTRREARWLVGVYLFRFHLGLRYHPGRRPETPAECLARIHDRLAAIASQRRDRVRQEWRAVWDKQVASARSHASLARPSAERKALGAFADLGS